MKKGKIMCTALAALLAAAMLAACGGGSTAPPPATAEPATEAPATQAPAATTVEPTAPVAEAEPAEEAVTIRSFAHMTSSEKIGTWEAIGEEFKANNPGFALEHEDTPFDNYNSLMKTKIAAGDAPDLIFGRPANRLDLIKADSVCDVTPYVDYTYIDDATKAAVSFEGKPYGAPLDLTLRLVFYNTRLFEEAGITSVPKTRTEFIAACEALQAKGVLPLFFGCKDQGVFWSHIFYCDFFGAPFSKDTNFMADMMARNRKWVDADNFRASLERTEALLAYGQDIPYASTYNEEEDMFAAEKCAMIINGTWSLSSVPPKNPNGPFDVFVLPITDDPSDLVMNAMIDDCWMIATQSENKELAGKLASFAISPEGSNIWVKGTGSVTTVQGTTEMGNFLGIKVNEYIRDSGLPMFNAHTVPNLEGAFDANWQTIIEEFGSDNNRSADKTLQALDDEFDKLAGR